MAAPVQQQTAQQQASQERTSQQLEIASGLGHSIDIPSVTPTEALPDPASAALVRQGEDLVAQRATGQEQLTALATANIPSSPTEGATEQSRDTQTEEPSLPKEEDKKRSPAERAFPVIDELVGNENYRRLQRFREQRINQQIALLGENASEANINSAAHDAGVEATRLFVVETFRMDPKAITALGENEPEVKEALRLRENAIKEAIRREGVDLNTEKGKARARELGQEVSIALENFARIDMNNAKNELHNVSNYLANLNQEAEWGDQERKIYRDLMKEAREQEKAGRITPERRMQTQLEFLASSQEHLEYLYSEYLKNRLGPINIFEIIFSLALSIGKGVITQANPIKANQ